jgi:ankyrin repeat protein
MFSPSVPISGCAAAPLRAAGVLLLCALARADDHAGPDATAAREQARARIEMLGWETTPERFLTAMATGVRPLIELYLDAGAPVNLPDARGRTPLLLAMLGQDWALAERLLATGGDFSKADEDGTTPAMAAAAGGHARLLRALIERGARLDTADVRGHTPLHYATAAGQREAVDLLLQVAPAPTPAGCCEGCNLLGHALQTRDWQIIDPILARLPGPLEWNQWSRDALLDALGRADQPRAQRLLARHPGAPTAEGGQPLLAHAVARNDRAQLWQLLELGLDPNTTLTTAPDAALREVVAESYIRHYTEKEPGLSVLMLAAAMKHEECVKLLLEKGANRNASTQGRSKLIALYFAAWADSPECVQLLLGRGPSREELRIEISLDQQKAEMLRDGVTVFTAPISSGRKGFPTPTGDFIVTDKKRDHRSSIYRDAKMPYFMRLSCRDFGMHEGALPGRPASHGCIRLPGAAARKLFREVPIGTWVTIRR